MLYLTSTDYDPVSRTLTARFRSAGGAEHADYEYRDVPVELFDRLQAARPHSQDVLDEVIAPAHDVRRAGQPTWHAPTVAVWDPTAVPA